MVNNCFAQSQQSINKGMLSPSEEQLIGIFQQKYTTIKEKLKTILNSNVSKINLVIEGWVNEDFRDYLLVAAYFIDNNQIQEVPLDLIKCDKEDPKSILSSFIECLQNYNITHKIFSITTDNCNISPFFS